MTSAKTAQAAYFAQAGACNPIPLVKALAEGIDEVKERGTDAITSNSALRLIVHQLCWLFDIGIMNDSSVEYEAACERVNEILEKAGLPDRL